MTKNTHNVYIGTFVVIILGTLVFMILSGWTYYHTPLHERFYHDSHDSLKPSGILGHGLGIIGTLLIIFGVSSYMIRKRVRRFSRIGVLKYWLEFHIFLCILGPMMVLFHTAFKFGGIVSISFWSMVIVVLSGVIGRFIYIQIPRTIQGRELTLGEIKDMQGNLGEMLERNLNLSQEDYSHFVELAESSGDATNMTLGKMFRQARSDRKQRRKVRKYLRSKGIKKVELRSVLKLVKEEMIMNQRIARLSLMQELFRYWHVAHLPFAIIMLVIVVIHVGVTLTFGYKWIF